MPKRSHVLVCVQNRPAGHPRGSCQSKGGASVYQTFVEEFAKRSLWDTFQLTHTGCLGPCRSGASVLIYPEGVLYGNVSASDVPTIIEQHLVAGSVVPQLAIPNW
jgi:(2Fe-2S) ferredoxin